MKEIDQKNKERMLNTLRQRKRRAQLKQHAIDMLGGKCAICGSTENLEFDHIDRLTKKFSISDGFASRSASAIDNELLNCQLLCHTCHVSKTKMTKDNANCKLSNDDVTYIKELYALKQYSQIQIAKMFDISQKTVSDIVNGKRRIS